MSSPARAVWPRRAGVCLALGLLAVAHPLAAQVPEPTPSPPPDRLRQDDLDLQARSNVVQGSGARAFGMGGAFLARADDATAASWNPAGLSYLRRPEVSLVWVGVNTLKAAVRNVEDQSLVADDHRHGNAPDFAAVTYPFELGSVTGAAQISFQRVISFDGRRTIDNADGSTVVNSSGGFDVVALGSGWQLTRKLRLGVTLNRWIDGYHQRRDREVPRGSSQQDVSFDISGWNVHLGAIWSPWESLNLGAVAKTSFAMRVDLRRSRTDLFPRANGPALITQNSFEANDVVLDFPGAAGVGLSWRPRSALTLSADYTRTRWSRGDIRNFFTLPRKVPGEPPLPPLSLEDVFDLLPYPSLYDFSGRGQTDTQQARAGVEYVLIRGRVKIPLRTGYFSDGQYFRGAAGGAPRFDGWTAGTGVIVGSLLLDVAYVNESAHYTALDYDGAFVGRDNSIRSHRVLVSAIYRHPRSR